LSRVLEKLSSIEQKEELKGNIAQVSMIEGYTGLEIVA
jgi:hypothetical protein